MNPRHRPTPTSLLRCRRGFTLSELATSIVMMSITGAAITSVVTSTFNSVAYQSRVTDAQLDVASALALLQDDLRTAGYIMDGMNQPVFQSLVSGTTADSITFTGDVNSDDVTERITYSLSDTTLMRTQDTWNGSGWNTGDAQPVAENVTVLTLKFFLVDPCTAVISQQTADDVLSTGQTTFISIIISGTGTYKGNTITRTLTSDVAGRQGNVLPVCT